MSNRGTEALGPTKVSNATPLGQQPVRQGLRLELMTVVEHSTDQCVSVSSNTPGSSVAAPMQGIYLPAVLTSGLGVGFRHRLQPGTSVLCAVDSHFPNALLYVIGPSGSDGIPSEHLYPWSMTGLYEGGAINNSEAKVLTKDIRHLYQDQVMQGLNTGEVSYENILNVGASFQTFLSRLSAGHAAKIECCLLNEMVRIVSTNFTHFSSLGDYKIVTKDGKTTAVWEYTGYEHERMNSLEPGEATLEPSAESASRVKTTSGKLAEEKLRSRFTMFVGYLGDFINMWVHDPVDGKATVKDGEPEAAKVGRFRIHVGNDGKFVVQSVSDIVLERVERIFVPSSKITPEVEESMLQDDPAYCTNPLMLNEPLRGEKPADIVSAAYNLRSYAHWIANASSLARLRKSKEYELTKDNGVVPLNYSTGDQARKVNEELTALEVYATIRIFRDGMIALRDGLGASVVLAGGDLHLQAPRHLVLKAGGDIIMTPGNNFIVRAKQNVELTAEDDGFIVRANKWVKMAVAKGGMHLKCTKPTKDWAPDLANETVTPVVSVPEKHIINGLVLETDQSSVTVLSDKNLYMKVKGVVIGSVDKLCLYCAGTMQLEATKLIASINSVLAKCMIKIFGTLSAEELRVKRAETAKPEPRRWLADLANEEADTFVGDFYLAATESYDSPSFASDLGPLGFYHRYHDGAGVAELVAAWPLSIHTPDLTNVASSSTFMTNDTHTLGTWDYMLYDTKRASYECGLPWPYVKASATAPVIPVISELDPSVLPTEIKLEADPNVCLTHKQVLYTTK